MRDPQTTQFTLYTLSSGLLFPRQNLEHLLSCSNSEKHPDSLRGWGLRTGEAQNRTPLVAKPKIGSEALPLTLEREVKVQGGEAASMETGGAGARGVLAQEARRFNTGPRGEREGRIHGAGVDHGQGQVPGVLTEFYHIPVKCSLSPCHLQATCLRKTLLEGVSPALGQTESEEQLYLLEPHLQAQLCSDSWTARP